jgi:hypothetical protein
MAKDFVGDIASEAKDKPVGEGKMTSQSGLPHKHEAKKMPHEHFTDKMTGALTGDCR